ncbi:MAG: hypothetical protein IJS58_01725 [Bacilli bacterium]|nr:hypothetical protein [Bacilli bacterium]
MAVKSIFTNKLFLVIYSITMLALVFFCDMNIYIGAGLIIAYYLIVKKSNVWKDHSTELSKIFA